MARRKDNLLKDIMDLLMVLPWWCSPIASIIAYVGLGSILPTLLPVENPLFLGISRGLPHLAVFFALVLLIPMPFAFFNTRRKKRLLDAQSGIESIQSLSWRQFEELVAEAYRRDGYSVRENLKAGADGGVDVRLQKDGQLHLVQCKQWKSQKVGVSVVREMFGVMVAEGAATVSVFTSGYFTQEAKNFAEGKPIDLVDGPALSNLVGHLQSGSNPVTTSQHTDEESSQACPKCGGELVARTAKKGANVGKQFIGCTSFPRCRYTRNVV